MHPTQRRHLKGHQVYAFFHKLSRRITLSSTYKSIGERCKPAADTGYHYENLRQNHRIKRLSAYDPRNLLFPTETDEIPQNRLRSFRPKLSVVLSEAARSTKINGRNISLWLGDGFVRIPKRPVIATAQVVPTSAEQNIELADYDVTAREEGLSFDILFVLLMQSERSNTPPECFVGGRRSQRAASNVTGD
uniref:Uncharacterized protein n=1 Tax=Angiostrongylus cantonensis TaxID=6313 RepID=A0A0K0CUY8_ANGCA